MEWSQRQLLSYHCDQTLARSNLGVEGSTLAHGYHVLGREDMGAHKVAGHIVSVLGRQQERRVSTQLASLITF